MRTKYKLVFVYDGSDFFGWQKQKNTSETIQEKIEHALSELFKDSISVVGSGRTDAKVHSLDQHVVFEAPFEIEPLGLVRGVNTKLPDGVRCKSAEILKQDLRPTYDAKSRTYIYLFSLAENYTPFQRHYMSHFNYDLDIASMQRAATNFLGRHDFKSFMTTGSDIQTTKREIFEIDLVPMPSQLNGIFPEHYKLTIRANGFLKQMVRLIVGALIEVGKGRLSEKDILNALQKADGQHIAPCAPPEGLFKQSVEY